MTNLKELRRLAEDWLTSKKKYQSGQISLEEMSKVNLAYAEATEPPEILALLDRLEASERDARRLQFGIKNARWIRHEHEAYVAIPVALDADLSTAAGRVAAIDAALKEPQ